MEIKKMSFDQMEQISGGYGQMTWQCGLSLVGLGIGVSLVAIVTGPVSVVIAALGAASYTINTFLTIDACYNFFFE